jgi:hypothetical protein
VATASRYTGPVASDYEFSLSAADFEPPADRKRWTQIPIEQGASPTSTKAAIQALATDPESGEVWVGIFDELVHIGAPPIAPPRGKARASSRAPSSSSTIAS